MSHDDDNTIKTPLCPVCSGPAAYPYPSLTPWFCINDECDVLGWDPYSTLEENLTDAAPVEVRHIQCNFEEKP